MAQTEKIAQRKDMSGTDLESVSGALVIEKKEARFPVKILALQITEPFKIKEINRATGMQYEESGDCGDYLIQAKNCYGENLHWILSKRMVSENYRILGFNTVGVALRQGQ